MTIKLILLKSGEDLISDVEEIVFGEKDEDVRIVGYYLTKPCVVKMISPSFVSEVDDKGPQKKGYQVSLYPWIPLTLEEKIPIPSDWLITMVDPTPKLKEMYMEDIINYKNDNDNRKD